MNSLRNLIIPFVAQYDIPFRLDQGVGLLWQEGCFEIPSLDAPTQQLATFVGASYCSMIREDVHYRLPEGIRIAQRSRDAVNTLQTRFFKMKRRSSELVYVLVRWRDAYGRLLYRTGNYSLARIEFERCAKFFKGAREGYWYRFDIQSNLLRTEFEVRRQAGDFTKRAMKKLHRKLVEAADQAESFLKIAETNDRKLELRRSLLSCLHNATEIYNKTLNKKFNLPNTRERYEKIAERATDDIYRHAQFLNMKANSTDKSQVNEKRQIYRTLLESKWKRGRFIADQNLAHLNFNLDKLIDLCEQIEMEIRASGGIDAMDIDRFDWTLILAEQLVENSKKKVPEKAQSQLLRYQEVITESVSQVISVPAYRTQFETKIRNRLRQVVFNRITNFKSLKSKKDRSQQFDQLVDRLENLNAREILEVLRVNRNQQNINSSSFRNPGFLIPDKANKKPEKVDSSFGTAGLPILPVAAHTASESVQDQKLATKLSQKDQEYWLDRPLQIKTITDSPSQRARQVTTAQSDLAIIRFVVQEKHQTNKLKFTAFWWHRGESGMVDLPESSIKLAKAWENKEKNDDNFLKLYNDDTKIPKPNLCNRLWDGFFSKVLDAIQRHFSGTPLKISELTLVLDAGLNHLPLNLAWVPRDCNYFPKTNGPLGQICNVAFSLNLTAHLIDGRNNLKTCIRHSEDDLTLLYYDKTKRFEEFGDIQKVRSSIRTWGRRGKLPRRANKDAIIDCLKQRAEYLAIMCHGGFTDNLGPSLKLDRCRLISQQFSHNAWLHGNKLSIIGACDAGTTKPDSNAQLIGAFIAAGGGAILANPSPALIFTVCDVASTLLEGIGRSKTDPFQLPDELRKASLVTTKRLNELIHPETDPETKKILNPAQLKICASTYQLWL